MYLFVSGCRQSQNQQQTTTARLRGSGTTVRITLPVHPLYGREIEVLGCLGRKGLLVELPSGRTCHLPLEWTDRQPRPVAMPRDRQPVRLTLPGVLALAAFTAARAERCQKIAEDNRMEQDGAHDVVARPTSGPAPTAAVVGQACSPRPGRAIGRRRRAARGKG